ncbi:MAG: nucleoside monophosphate kinase [Lutibacter sp.]|uniref:adenylate kinase family protein n=1 Tax=Lutibacter sp. TaxID=1925666 RepID=UPI0038582391
MKIVIITGPPYSGKGTQCRILKEKLGYNHISTGDQCRIEKENNTAIGKILSEYEEKGDLVPDAIIKDLFEKVIDKNLKGEGIILDGYPRTISQVKDLIKLVTLKELKIKKVVHINVPHNELLVRAQKRAETSNRIDDKDVRIHKKRIEIYKEFTQPAIEFMKLKLNFIEVDGLGEIDKITMKIIQNLK